MELPEDFGNVCEIERVTHLVNFSGIKGVEIKMQQRSLPKNGNKVRIKFAKMARRIGRLHELDRRLSRKQIDDETYCLMDKLFGHCEVQAQEVKAELHKLTQSYQKSNEQEKRDKISNWSLRLRQSIGAKSDWINKKGSTKSPVICKGDACAGTKTQVVKFLFDYWQSLWQGQNGRSDHDLQLRVGALRHLHGATFGNEYEEGKHGRPSLELFRQRLVTINGCPGADDWSKHEIKMVAGHEDVASMIWDSMQIWEETQKIPDSEERQEGTPTESAATHQHPFGVVEGLERYMVACTMQS